MRDIIFYNKILDVKIYEYVVEGIIKKKVFMILQYQTWTGIINVGDRIPQHIENTRRMSSQTSISRYAAEQKEDVEFKYCANI